MDSKFYKELLDAIADGIYFLDTDRTITFWNKAAERLTGYTAEEVIGRSCAENLLRHVTEDGTELCVTGCPMLATMQDGCVCDADVYLHHKLGHRVPVHVRSSPMRDESGEIVGAVEIFTDNGRQLDILKEMECLRREVLTDSLTGVGNRRYADIILERLGEVMAASGGMFGVLFVDIDHFKWVNDKWGHLVGDVVLTMVARTMKNTVRPMDSVCRWGGEEFVVLIPNTTPEELAHMAERLRMMVGNSWVAQNGEHLSVTVSVGGAVSCVGECPANVVDRADQQNYLSKAKGRNCTHIEGLAE